MGLLVWLCSAGVHAEEKQTSPEEIGKKSVMEINQDVLENLTTEEQKWYKTFHDGILFFDGWSNISQDILEIYPADQVAKKSPMLQRLGIKIGTEWSRQNRARRIETTQLKEWGERLRGSIAEGPESTTRTLLEIEQEVDLLLKDNSDLSQVSPQS
jgi:hypothetical protein